MISLWETVYNLFIIMGENQSRQFANYIMSNRTHYSSTQIKEGDEINLGMCEADPK